MADNSDMGLSCCFCADRRWDASDAPKLQIRLGLPTRRMRQWFGCHEDCLEKALHDGDRICAVCGRGAGRTEDVRITVQQSDPAKDRQLLAHLRCLQRTLASGYTVELDLDEPLREE